MKNKLFTKFFLLLSIFSSSLFAAAVGPIESFKVAFIDQSTNYAVPVILFVVLIATAITYMKTKDWTISLVTGAISAALIGGASSLLTSFSGFTF